MGKSGLHLVIGGKSLGKTKIVQTIVDNASDETPLLYVNMRVPSKAQSTDALEWNVCKKKLSEDGPQRICLSEQNSWWSAFLRLLEHLADLRRDHVEGAVETLLFLNIFSLRFPKHQPRGVLLLRQQWLQRRFQS